VCAVGELTIVDGKRRSVTLDKLRFWAATTKHRSGRRVDR
jgi:hypothetical protein